MLRDYSHVKACFLYVPCALLNAIVYTASSIVFDAIEYTIDYNGCTGLAGGKRIPEIIRVSKCTINSFFMLKEAF